MTHPHILLLPSWYPTDYAPIRGNFFREQAQALKEAGAQVGVIYVDFRSYRTLKAAHLLGTRFQIEHRIERGIATYRYCGWNPLSARWRYRWTINLSQRMWRRYIAKWGVPDIIHAHSVIWGGAAASALARQTGIPYILTEHSSGYARGLIRPWQRPIIEGVLLHAAALLAVSPAVKQILTPYVPSRSDEIIVTPNMVNTSFFHLPSTPRASRPFRFLSVANLNRNKGLDIVLRAFAQAFEQAEEVILEIGGDGPERTALERLVVELNIQARVVFLGRLSREEVRAAMWRANALVLASHIETFGVVLIEAMATGLPVIATRSGGPEQIVTSRTGVLVERGNVSALARAMKHLRENRCQWGDEAAIRQEAISNYDQQVIANRLLEIYAKTLNPSP